ncbi:MAG: ADP-glyceromanno-heptose 6-epimerase [bacterium]
MSSASILVTGGAGLIGSALIHALNQRGREDILVTDVLGEEMKWKNLSPLKFDDYLQADSFLDLLECNPDALNSIRTIYHLGACSATTERDVGYLMENNYGYTKILAQWALQRGIRFVYASSAATYGDGTRGMDDGTDHLDTLRPLNAYGYSKHLFDLHAKRNGWLQREDGIVGIKYFNVYGPNEEHKGEMRSLVSKAYEQIVETGKVRLFRSHRPDFRDGEQMRDFVYVKDAVAMTIHLAETPSAHGLFNIGTGTPRTWIDLTNALFVALDRKPKIEFIDMPDHIRNQYQYQTCADVSRLLATGWSAPTTTLEAAVSDYVRNYLVPGNHLGDEIC